jgi:cytochrome c biogenesis protein CcmG, thiol:disulfide interchange protein DsbE
MPFGVPAGAVRRMARRHRLASAIVGICLAAAVAAGLVAATSGSSSPAQPQAAGFSVTVLGQDSQHLSLSQYAGRPVVVNFFASWCAPCRQETPLLARFYRTEQGRVPIIGLDENDSAPAAQKFAAQAGVTYPVGFDPAVQAANAYGVTALPQTFFLNSSHHIVKRVFGALTTTQLTAGIAEITGKA